MSRHQAKLSTAQWVINSLTLSEISPQNVSIGSNVQRTSVGTSPGISKDCDWLDAFNKVEFLPSNARICCNAGMAEAFRYNFRIDASLQKYRGMGVLARTILSKVVQLNWHL